MAPCAGTGAFDGNRRTVYIGNGCHGPGRVVKSG
jgi:hypothetical protein